MQYNVLRGAAISLSLMGVCSVASAQYGSVAYPTAPPYPGQQYQTGQPYQAGQPFQVGQYPGNPVPGSQPQPASSQTPQYRGPSYQMPQAPGPHTQAQLGVPRVNAAPTQTQPSANTYQPPAKWNRFGVTPTEGPTLYQPASMNQATASEMIPTPSPTQDVMALPMDPVTPSNLPSRTNSAPPMTPVPSASHSYPPPNVSYATPSASSVPHSVTHLPPTDDSCETCNQTTSPYAAAAAQPWEGVSYGAGPACGVPAAPVRAPLFPWFGSFDVLFLDFENNGKNRNLVSRYDAVDATRPYLPSIGSGVVDPDSGVGYSLSFGRYLGCGQYGLGVTYFHFDPDEEVFESAVQTPMGLPGNAGANGPMRAVGMPQYRGATMPYWYDNGAGPVGGDTGAGYQEITGAAGPYTVYDIIDGSAGYRAADGGDGAGGAGDTDAMPEGFDPANPPQSNAEAVRFQARRNVGFQGIQFNLFSFGLMGAQRASALGSGHPGLCRFLGGFGGIGGYGAQACGPAFGFGGLGGPLVRPCHGRVQIVTSHGFRWFQFEDNVNYAFDVDGRAGYTMHDVYDNTEVENNLFGYQFGSRLNYCIGSRLNLGVGGNFGIYGNDIDQRHRLGSLENAAELAAMPGLDIDFTSSDTTLATLGELDFGLGYRVCNGVTARFGYRLLGVTGVASADGYSRDYSSTANARQIHANESILLHGFYVGTDLNW